MSASSAVGIELNAKGVDKAEGLLALGRRLGIEPAFIMACGDAGNDLPMLRRAGVGVAMGNAAPAVKSAAASSPTPMTTTAWPRRWSALCWAAEKETKAPLFPGKEGPFCRPEKGACPGGRFVLSSIPCGKNGPQLETGK